MLVGSHPETGDERRAVAAPQVVAGAPHSRARSGRFGMLWLTALTFWLVNKAQAADPGVTYLDDGNITYKDLEHGAFELVTKEAIPRHFLVEDPGQTVILRTQGSSVSISQSTNSPARMAELQAAQQEALAIYEKGLGSTGSSTPPGLEALPVQPINFIQNDDGPPELELLAPTPSIFTSIPETIFGKLPPPPPVPPTLNAVLGPTETDTVVFDLFTATSGTFLASSPNSSTLTFGIEGGTAGNSVINGATYDVSEAGPYGTLYVDSTTGDYTFVPDSDAINALVAPTTTDFTITVSDGTLSADQTFTIAINGTNDAAIISGTTSGTATETGSAASNTLAAASATGTPSATGTLTNTDVDDAPNSFRAVETPATSAKGFGTFTMAANGVWAYTIDQGNSAVQALNVGDTLTDSFTVTSIDGTEQVVTITIHGANDADPNDFDYLATHKHVVSDPPYIFGTRGDDIIDKCGHHGRIIFTGAGDDSISATGKCDLIYAGSGNDAVKGNDGDDTIYGGSGRDTIYGGDGCDTIVGGYGADHLTGGKGNDSFVFLSAADSNAARFDIISDFKCGSDRIDLTALGALTLLALTSASTSVPAHTVAWFYDSATNQTILYVNPTGQTHDIGDSALLEIHLEGLVTVQASDFVPEPTEAPVMVAAGLGDPELTATAESDATVVATAADASLELTDSHNANVHDGSWTLRTAFKTDRFDFAHLDEARAQPAQSTNDDEAVAVTSGPSVDAHRAHVTAPAESNLAPDQTSTHDKVVHNASLTVLNDDKGASQRIEQHNDWSFSSVTHSSSVRDDDDRGQQDDHRPSTVKDADEARSHAWNDRGNDHHSNSNKHDTAWHGDSFHFKEKVFVLEVSGHGEADHAWATASHRGYTERSSEPPVFSETAQATGMASSNHHASDNSKHHWSDNFHNGPDHAWGGGHTHAPHHDLMV